VYITNGAKETIRENITISTKRVQVIMNWRSICHG
jgi:hypothetical protein